MNYYENEAIKIEQDGEVFDIDILSDPGDGAWIGIFGMDVRIRRAEYSDGPYLEVEVWQPGVVSSPVAETSAKITRQQED